MIEHPNQTAPTSERGNDTRSGCSDKTSAFLALYLILQRWFYNPDLQAIRIVLGAIKSHYLRIGDPVWLFLIGPPGTGKTTMSIFGACGLPEVQMLSDLTESAFLNGYQMISNCFGGAE